MTEIPYSIRSVQRVCDILDLVQDRPDGLTLVDVSAATGLPKSSAFRYLATLESRGYIERNGSGDYLIGIALRSERIDVLVQRARPHLKQLRDELGETASLGMLDGSWVVYLAIEESRRSTRTVQSLGVRYPIHSSAFGKVLTAWKPADFARSILEREGMPRFTEHTITDPDDYIDELARVRADGYAVNDREGDIDGRCVAVPVAGARLPIALSLSAPASRLPATDVPAVARSLTAAAAAFAAALGSTSEVRPEPMPSARG